MLSNICVCSVSARWSSGHRNRRGSLSLCHSGRITGSSKTQLLFWKGGWWRASQRDSLLRLLSRGTTGPRGRGGGRAGVKRQKSICSQFCRPEVQDQVLPGFSEACRWPPHRILPWSPRHVCVLISSPQKDTGRVG